MNSRNLTYLITNHKLDLKILRLMKYGKGKTAKKLFNPLVFKKRYNLPDFTFNDYIHFASEFTKNETNDLIEITKNEIKELGYKIKEIKHHYKSEAQSKFITPINISHRAHKAWGVMDFETYSIEGTGVQVPYAWGFKIGDTKQIIIKFHDPYPAILKTLHDMTSLINKKVVIYVHNLSKFDSYFIINAALMGDLSVDIIKTENGFMLIIVKFQDKEIHFHDSLLILPSSLRTLSDSFKVNTPKRYFPHLFVSPKTAEYDGNKPSIDFYYDVTEDVYNNIPTNFNMKQEIHTYLHSDLLSLYEVLEKFMDWVLGKYEISITNILTLPQLAFTIWRKKYLKWREVYILPEPIEEDIRNAYYGGACEVYRPTGKRAWFYDINSMYPWAMTQPMPVGRPITHIWENKPFEDIMGQFFGFLKVEIEIKKGSTYAPILPRKRDGENGEMLFPTGRWVGWYFSEELKAAHNSGLYKITTLMGYAFKKDSKVLTSYVEEFYKMKTEARDSVTRSIAKLLLNSLYGRLGMKKISQKTIISDENQPLNNMLDMETLDGHKDKIIYTLSCENNKTQSNVAMAAAITAYSRIKSFTVIRKHEDTIMYHDTDSFVLSKPIKSDFLGDGLGQMKNVVADDCYKIKDDPNYHINNPLFVAPKVYTFESPNGEKTVKIKGIRKSDQTEETVERLYFDMNITTKTTQFRRHIKPLEIRIKEKEKKLFLYANKRIKIYKQGVWIDTKPIDL